MWRCTYVSILLFQRELTLHSFSNYRVFSLYNNPVLSSDIQHLLCKMVPNDRVSRTTHCLSRSLSPAIIGCNQNITFFWLEAETQSKSLECAHKSQCNYISVNLHKVEEMRDINSWRPQGAAAECEKQSRFDERKGKKRRKKPSHQLVTSKCGFPIIFGVGNSILWLFLFSHTGSNLPTTFPAECLLNFYFPML